MEEVAITINKKDIETLRLFIEERPKIPFVIDSIEMKDSALQIYKENARTATGIIDGWLENTPEDAQ